MRKTMWIAASLVMALAACGKSGSGGNGQQSAAVSGASEVQMQPGEWEMTVETTDIGGAGLPPGYAAAMKGHKVTRRNCLTPEEAAHPMEKMVQGQQDHQCNYSGFSIAGGHIQGTISCGSDKSQSKMTMTMNGQYDGQNYAYTSRMTSEGQGMNMTITSQASAHRVGDCPAGGKESEK